MKALLFVTLLGIAAGAAADGPGSRIRATPAPPQPAGPVDKDLQRCESMDGAQKERCLRALRVPVATPAAARPVPAPERAARAPRSAAPAS